MTIEPSDLLTGPKLPWPGGDPFAFYRRLRAEHGPVHWNESAKSWLVLDYDPVRKVLASSGWTSNPSYSRVYQELPDAAKIDADLLSRLMVFADPPKHNVIRGSMAGVFTHSYVSQLVEGIEAIADDVVSAAPTGTEIDLMTVVAKPLTLAVLAELFDLGPAAAQELWRQAPAFVRLLDVFEIAALVPTAAAFTSLVTELLPLALQRRQHPTDDVLSLIAAEQELELGEVVSNALLVAVAAQETTPELIGSGMTRLLTQTTAGRIVDTLDTADEATMALAVEELLRLDGSTQLVGRTATDDQLVGGQHIRAGDRAIAVIASASRDPAIYDDPDEFRLDRPNKAVNLAFGFGRHRCLGSTLARLEIRIALRHIIDRSPRLVGPVTWRDTSSVRGPHHVPIVFDH